MLTLNPPTHIVDRSLGILDDLEPEIPEHNARDLPIFSYGAANPILYLSPLLSSLPQSSLAPQKPIEHPPLKTETPPPDADADPASLSLYRALHLFRPVDVNYASRSYSDAFNWDEFQLPADDEREWYCVAFRSLRKVGSEDAALYEADKAAYEEAAQGGGLIMYWFGIPSPENGRNMATCIWRSRQHALEASQRPQHARAAKLAEGVYEKYELERWVARKIKGETRIRLERYKTGSVGW